MTSMDKMKCRIGGRFGPDGHGDTAFLNRPCPFKSLFCDEVSTN